MLNQNKWKWIMLFSRIFLFFLLQLLLGFIFLILGKNQPLVESEKWWPFIVTLTNIICIFLLIRLFKTKGKNFWHIYKVKREHLKQDILNMFIVLLLIAPIGFLPNFLLSQWLFDDIESSVDFLVRPIPMWAAFFSIIFFPITQGIAELAVYFGYVMPKLEEDGYSKGFSLTLPALLLGLQHIAVPFVFNVNYLVWRGLMYLPFAFLVGIIIKKNPRLFPYLAVVHILMDMSFAAMFLLVAY